jgi:hypothetical protein
MRGALEIVLDEVLPRPSGAPTAWMESRPPVRIRDRQRGRPTGIVGIMSSGPDPTSEPKTGPTPGAARRYVLIALGLLFTAVGTYLT